MAVAAELKRAKHDLQTLLTAADYQALDHFFSRTVEAAQVLLPQLGPCTAVLPDNGRWP